MNAYIHIHRHATLQVVSDHIVMKANDEYRKLLIYVRYQDASK